MLSNNIFVKGTHMFLETALSFYPLIHSFIHSSLKSHLSLSLITRIHQFLSTVGTASATAGSAEPLGPPEFSRWVKPYSFLKPTPLALNADLASCCLTYTGYFEWEWLTKFCLWRVTKFKSVRGFLQGYSTVWWILAMGLTNLLGIADLHLPKGRKYQMVKTQTESHDWRPIVWTNRW